jgi:hypothetical protein
VRVQHADAGYLPCDSVRMRMASLPKASRACLRVTGWQAGSATALLQSSAAAGVDTEAPARAGAGRTRPSEGSPQAVSTMQAAATQIPVLMPFMQLPPRIGMR